MSNSAAYLGTWDYVSLSALVILASAVAVYQIFANRKSTSARQFLVRNRELGVLPLILSTLGSQVSAIAILGFSAETYVNGAQVMLISIGYLLTIPFVIYLYLTVFFNLGKNTIFEGSTATTGRIGNNNLKVIFHSSVVIYAPTLALCQVAGLHLWPSVGCIGTVCIIYTAMGGIKAVVWADACQVIVMLLVLSLIVAKGTIDVGGLSEIWRIATEGQRTQFHVLSVSKYSPYTVWTMIVASGSAHLSYLSANQMMVQRYLSNKTLTGARITVIGGTIIIAIMALLSAFSGLIFYARYHKCDPLLNGQIRSRDQLFPLFAAETLSFCQGLTGIFAAAILCATLSTLSSTLNSLSTLVMEDFIRPMRPHLTESSAKMSSIILGITFGIICIALVAVVDSVSGLVKMTFIISGVLGGPILTIFTIGMLLPWVNAIGATAAFISGFLFCGWASIGALITRPVLPSAPIDSSGCNFSVSAMGNNFWPNVTLLLNDAGVAQINVSTEPLGIYTYSPMWYVLWSFGIGVIVSLFTSIATGRNSSMELDSKLFFPIVIKTIRRLPKSFQRKIGFQTEIIRSPKAQTLLPLDTLRENST